MVKRHYLCKSIVYRTCYSGVDWNKEAVVDFVKNKIINTFTAIEFNSH